MCGLTGVGVGSGLRSQLHGELYTIRKQWPIHHQVGHRGNMRGQTVGLRDPKAVRISGGGYGQG